MTMKVLLFVLALFALSVGSAKASKYPREVVVKIEAPAPYGGTGSAVVLQPGLLLTARHMTEGVAMVLSGSGGETVLIGSPEDPSLDVAALKAPGVVCPCVELADSDAELDEKIVIIGFPMGVTSQVTHGESQGVVEVPTVGRRLVTTVPVEGGNSGGGAFVKRDGRWQLVGILAEGSKTQGLVVPVSELRRWLEGRSRP